MAATVAWLTDSSWQSCVDAAVAYGQPEAELVLVYVTPDEVRGVAHGAFAGLLGRGRRDRDPAALLAAAAAGAAEDVLDAARERGGDERTVRTEIHLGRAEQAVVGAANGADLLVVARDGDDSRLGPHSLGPATRFVVDHAPCPVLLVWPGRVPSIGSIPPPPATPPAPPPERPRPPAPGTMPGPPRTPGPPRPS